VSKVHFPAEWEFQSGLLLTWPHPKSDWKPILRDVEQVYLDIVRRTVERETVVIACYDESHQRYLMDRLLREGISPRNYQIYQAASNDSWTRDHGPITIQRESGPALIDFTFNGWGNKFPADKDNLITRKLHDQGAFGNTPLIQTDFILEGGSIDTDGKGTLLTTCSCLLSRTRNNQSREQINMVLSDYLNVDRILWLKHGYLVGDDTDGHIDTLVRFVNEDTLVYVSSRNREDPNYSELNNMASELHNLTKSNGRPYELIALPSPFLNDGHGQMLPASYANFLMINNAVLLPVYGIKEDEEALSIFRDIFNDREILPIDCRTLINQSGSLHCITMQLPQGVVP